MWILEKEERKMVEVCVAEMDTGEGESIDGPACKTNGGITFSGGFWLIYYENMCREWTATEIIFVIIKAIKAIQ